MGLALMNVASDQREAWASDELLKMISKSWNKDQWELYLKQFECSQPKEEMYVGSTNDLEKIAARKSKFGSVPTAIVDDGIKLKGEQRGPAIKNRFGL